MEITNRIREFMENEARSCSMDFGCITPEYVYRSWGGEVPIEDISAAMTEMKGMKYNNKNGNGISVSYF